MWKEHTGIDPRPQCRAHEFELDTAQDRRQDPSFPSSGIARDCLFVPAKDNHIRPSLFFHQPGETRAEGRGNAIED